MLLEQKRRREIKPATHKFHCQVSEKVTAYLNCDKIKGGRWFKVSSGSKTAPCIAEHHGLPK